MNSFYISNQQIAQSTIQGVLSIHRIKTVVRAIVVFMVATCTLWLSAQNTESTEALTGKVDVSSTSQVRARPDNPVLEGNENRTYIPTALSQNPGYTVPTPSSSAIPAPGSSGMNYLKTISYREAKTTIPTTAFKHNEAISYYDGLGRSKQNISVGASPAGEDIIQPFLYDAFGREKFKTLPYTEIRTGLFRNSVTLSTVNSYYASIAAEEGIIQDNKAFTEYGFDDSPLNRVISQTGPGVAWANKPLKSNYLTNTAVVQGWIVNANGTLSSFNYAVNTLMITETTDEQGNVTREFKDKQGKIVQKASRLNGNWLRTAYIYDDLDLLRCVMPPKSSNPNNDVALCYYYKYDNQRRMIEKKIPGGGTVTMVYDKRDRLRCTQDSKQAAVNEWSFTKYDQWNRPVITGKIINYSTGATALETAINGAALNESRENSATYYGYSKSSFPNGAQSAEVNTVTYYDNYDFITPLGLGTGMLSNTYDSSPYTYSSIIDNNPVGQVTGTMTRVISPSDGYSVSDQLLYTALYYNKYGHVLRTVSENHLGGKDVNSNLYEPITYLMTSSKQQHYMNGQLALTLVRTFTYDHTGRPLSTVEQVNSQAAFTLNAMKYNKLGQLIGKYLHSDQTSGSRIFTQIVDYQYNIRGWITKINDPVLSGSTDFFGMQLCYETTSSLGGLHNSTGYYNGNIVGMKWSIINEITRGFTFSYDELNRLKTTNYAEGSSLNTNTGYCTESVTSYDNHGNILGLQRRYNNNLVDNLTYNYTASSNRLSGITEAANPPDGSGIDDYPGTSGSYAYDANGNMINDGSRNATLTYHNILNLPASVDFGNNNRIFYHYAASGSKLIKHVRYSNGSESFTHYIGNLVYEGSGLSYTLTEEGRLVGTGTGTNRVFVPEYNLKDHLGNNRVTFLGKVLSGSTVQIVQTANYYPFGLVMTQNTTIPASDYSKNKYLYNGKELQDDRFGSAFFGLLDYGARFYDPQIGRWHSVDPLAEVNRRWSPYRYAYDNPLRFIDPDGMLEEIIIKGPQANAATQQLDASTSLNISRDSKTGKISATGTATTKNDQKLLEAINSKDVTVNITADNSKTLNGNMLMVGGAFGGNTVETKTETTTINMGFEDAVGNNTMEINTTSTTVSTTQNVNPTVLGALDQANGNNGQAMLHETLESYEGGVISLSKGTSSPIDGQKGSVYNKAHNRAPSQGGVVTGEYWDRAGNALPDAPGAVKARISSNGKVIMTWP